MNGFWANAVTICGTSGVEPAPLNTLTYLLTNPSLNALTIHGTIDHKSPGSAPAP